MPELYFWSSRTLPELRPQKGAVYQIVSTDRVTLARIELAAEVVVESHKHDVDQVGTVLSGQIVMAIAGDQRVLGAGDCYRIPAGTAHGARVLHDKVVVVDCYGPARDDLRKVFEQQNARKPFVS